MREVAYVFFLFVLTMSMNAQIHIDLSANARTSDYIQKTENMPRDAVIHNNNLGIEKIGTQVKALEKAKQLYTWLGIVSVVALLLAFGLLLYRHKQLNTHKIKQFKKEKQLIATQAILEGETAERSRLARDLHDGLGGMLSVIKLNLNEINNSSVLRNTNVDRFNSAMKMLDQSIVELRRIAHHMMPESLLRFGLKTSIDDFCRAIPHAHFQYYGSEDRLERRLEVLLYRCAFELVNNAVKYANAKDIHVQLIVDNGLVSLTVHDNGAGFDPLRNTIGTGLRNIRTRVSAFNGKIFINSSPGKGTEVSIEFENTDNTEI
ncbi:MAG: sensor histidine kinase [Tannerella sp.]|jgi:signal transduction histidine kinase|nr:sensor histidine kinase [Tannerella sp.]